VYSGGLELKQRDFMNNIRHLQKTMQILRSAVAVAEAWGLFFYLLTTEVVIGFVPA